MPTPRTRRRLSVELLTPDEHLILAHWLDLAPHPDGAGTDVDGALQRIGIEELPQAVAYIVLEEVEKQLPQWTSYQSDGQGGETANYSRQYRNPKRKPLREKTLRPRHLFTINWATSGVGSFEMQWPAAYYVTWVPFYNRSIVTASGDGEEGGGDVALGFFARHRGMRRGAKEIIQAQWRPLATETKTERWEGLLSASLISAAEVAQWADEIWCREVRGARRY